MVTPSYISGCASWSVPVTRGLRVLPGVSGGSSWNVECSTLTGEVFRDAFLQGTQQIGGLLGGEPVVDDDVCSERGQVGGHLGRVQIVDLRDVVELVEVAAHFVQVQPRRGCFEKNAR